MRLRVITANYRKFVVAIARFNDANEENIFKKDGLGAGGIHPTDVFWL